MRSGDTNLHKSGDGAQWAAAAISISIRWAEHGGIAGPRLHHHLHQTILVPGTVLHQVDEQTQTLNTTDTPFTPPRSTATVTIDTSTPNTWRPPGGWLQYHSLAPPTYVSSSSSAALFELESYCDAFLSYFHTKSLQQVSGRKYYCFF